MVETTLPNGALGQFQLPFGLFDCVPLQGLGLRDHRISGVVAAEPDVLARAVFQFCDRRVVRVKKSEPIEHLDVPRGNLAERVGKLLAGDRDLLKDLEEAAHSLRRQRIHARRDGVETALGFGLQ
jgi:hypothetical protein